MNSTAVFFKTNVTLRVTALWAFSEALAGGILHGLKIPFAGLVLAYVASVCITLIALGNNKKGEIFKATLLVIAIKFILSPHTPPMAYVAVLIQGVAGELLFMQRKYLKPAALILTVFSLVYSAFQHLLILTLIFGKDFWQAIDIFLNKIARVFVEDAVSYSIYIVGFYIACYLLAGLAGGILNMSIINSVQSGYKTGMLLDRLNNLPAPVNPVLVEVGKPERKKTIAFIFGVIVGALLIFSYLPFFNAPFTGAAIALLLARAVLILLAWKFLIAPLLQIQIQKWVSRYKKKNEHTLHEVFALLPEIKIILQQSWQLSYKPTNWLRIKNFINNAVLLIVHKS
jgi:hypothetical protein